MKIGVPKEIKNNEFRVGLVPANVHELVAHQHQVIIETKAGLGTGYTDDDYRKEGATIVESADEVFAQAELIVKIKEPQASEIARLNEGHTLFTYLHLAPDPKQCEGLMRSKCTAIAYETVTGEDPYLPLLAPMSEVAGRLGTQVGASCLEKPAGGRGILLGGATGVAPGRVLVLGGGTVGYNAAWVACGMGAEVTILDISIPRLRDLSIRLNHRARCLYSTKHAIQEHIRESDLVIGGIYCVGESAPKLITREHLKTMLPGSVIVDVAIDQGGCCETAKPTTHENPTYIVDEVVHYCVANIPGATPRTSTHALNNAKLPYVIALADQGVKQALLSDPHLRNGLNVCHGQLTHHGVGHSLGKPVTDPLECLQSLSS